jgi:hypothetical protein
VLVTVFLVQFCINKRKLQQVSEVGITSKSHQFCHLRAAQGVLSAAQAREINLLILNFMSEKGLEN